VERPVGAEGNEAGATSFYPQGMSRLTGTGAGLIGGLILTLLLTSAASASLFLVLTEASGPAGTVVRGHTRGNQAFAQQVSPLLAFFVDREAADSVNSPEDARLAHIGQLAVDARGNGTITFVVPSLPVGPYALMVYCPSCAQFSAGRVMLSVADFTITPGSPNTAFSRSGTLLATIVGVILVVGSALSLRGLMPARKRSP
jgi:hypothetical protein